MDLGDGEVTLMGDLAAFLGAVTIVGYILVGRSSDLTGKCRFSSMPSP